jgi:trehalose 2-sulfotransferase
MSSQTKDYMICSTPRSGSMLLCQLASATGQLGNPAEILGKPRGMLNFQRQFNVSEDDDIRAFIEEVKKRTITPNGVFGFKAHYPYFDYLRRQIPIRDVFPNLRYVYIDRRDNCLQAASLINAATTGKWSTDHNTNNATKEYSFDALRYSTAALIGDKAHWEFFFSLCQIEPVRIFYEDLVRDPNAEISKIAKALEVPIPPVTLNNVSLRQQRGTTTYQWVERLTEDARRFFLDGPSPQKYLNRARATFHVEDAYGDEYGHLPGVSAISLRVD